VDVTGGGGRVGVNVGGERVGKEAIGEEATETGKKG
jgi:hypothetical protein